MSHVYHFCDVDMETAVMCGDGQVLPRKYTRFQIGYADCIPRCVIFWNENEPHVHFFHGVNNRIKLEGTAEFIKQHPHAVVKTLPKTKRLFDGVAKLTGLSMIRKGLDSLGRGIEYEYRSASC